jgi:hypothetical protein
VFQQTEVQAKAPHKEIMTVFQSGKYLLNRNRTTWAIYNYMDKYISWIVQNLLTFFTSMSGTPAGFALFALLEEAAFC